MKPKVTVKRYVHKENKTSVRVIEVTEENLETVRTLWRADEANIGEYVVRKGNDVVVILTEADFKKKYREPY